MHIIISKGYYNNFYSNEYVYVVPENTSSFCVFMAGNVLEVHKLAKRKKKKTNAQDTAGSIKQPIRAQDLVHFACSWNSGIYRLAG